MGLKLLDSILHSFHSLSHEIMKGVKPMNEITTITVRLPREDKDMLMQYAKERDLSASQIIRQMIRNYLYQYRMEAER